MSKPISPKQQQELDQAHEEMIGHLMKAMEIARLLGEHNQLIDPWTEVKIGVVLNSEDDPMRALLLHQIPSRTQSVLNQRIH